MDSRSANPRAPLQGQTAGKGATAPERAGGRERDEFCRFLRAHRERAALSIEDIARVTRIPEHSLRRLEAGQFDELPGDIFVRGFLRSYARCVGLEAGEVLRRYAECGMAPAPVASDLAAAAAADAAAVAHRDDGAEIVGRAGPAGVGAGTIPGSGSGTGSGSGSVTGSGTGSVAGPKLPVTAAGTRTGERAAKSTVAAGPGGQARSGKVSRGRRWRQRRGRRARAASQPAVRRGGAQQEGGREATDSRARSERAWRRRPSMLAVAIAVLVIAAVAVMSHLLRRPDERPRGGEAGSSSPAR